MKWLFRLPELTVFFLMAAVTVGFAAYLGTPFVVPDERIRIYLGIRYAVPVALAALWFAIPLVVRRHQGADIPSLSRELGWSALYVGVFTGIMWLHFHIKMWVPLINPVRFDEFYQRTDQMVQPLIDGMRTVREGLAAVLPNVDWWYIGVFVGMFFVSFTYHLVADRRGFRRVYLATLINQSLGALSYLIAPAVGPFLYGYGPNRIATNSQEGMWEAYNQFTANGPAWLDTWGTSYFNAGLAAMPSLHAGAAWVFVWYAFAHRIAIRPLYAVAFLWILIEAVVTRWHYVIDLPAGMILAGVSIWLANRMLARAERST